MNISVLNIGHILFIPQPSKCLNFFLTYPVEERSMLPRNRLLNRIQFSILASSSVLPGHYIDAVENQMKTIPCGSDAVDSNAKITWMRNGVEATKNPRFTLDTATGALVVNRADRNDSGSYNCSIMKIVKGRFTVVGYEMYFNVQCMYIFFLKRPSFYIILKY